MPKWTDCYSSGSKSSPWTSDSWQTSPRSTRAASWASHSPPSGPHSVATAHFCSILSQLVASRWFRCSSSSYLYISWRPACSWSEQFPSWHVTSRHWYWVADWLLLMAHSPPRTHQAKAKHALTWWPQHHHIYRRKYLHAWLPEAASTESHSKMYQSWNSNIATAQKKMGWNDSLNEVDTALK